MTASTTSDHLYETILAVLVSQLGQVPKSRLRTLARMVTGVLLGRNVQLWEMALWSGLEAKQSSIIHRFKQWLSHTLVNPQPLFYPFVKAMHDCLGPQQTAYIVLDCTKVGQHCRCLIAGLVYQHTVIPVAWKCIKGKKGHVKGVLQAAILSELFLLFGDRYRTVVILGDAEFSNDRVLRWFEDKSRWYFLFRFQGSYLVKQSDDARWLSAQEWRDEQAMTADALFQADNVTFTQEHRIPGLTFTIHWDKDEELPLYLISKLPPGAQPHLLYNHRYWVETLFANFKSRGFDLANTHLTDPKRIERLILVISIATCIALHVGTQLWLTGTQSAIDRTDRRDLSLFQCGIRAIVYFSARHTFNLTDIHFDWTLILPPAGCLSA